MDVVFCFLKVSIFIKTAQLTYILIYTTRNNSLERLISIQNNYHCQINLKTAPLNKKFYCLSLGASWLVQNFKKAYNPSFVSHSWFNIPILQEVETLKTEKDTSSPKYFILVNISPISCVL